MLTITKVDKNSIAQELGFEIGDKIITVNGREVYDFIDFTYMDGQSELELTVEDKKGKKYDLEIEKDEYEPLGIEVKDEGKIRVCKNKCAFCFVDQLPDGMRQTLYVKDDDWRYSLMCGNYVTLTNLSEYDLDRICEYGISPLYISVHAYDDDIRVKLVKNPTSRNLIPYMERMGKAGIKMHTQIVMCKGINDGEVLAESIEKISAIEGVQSIAVVPVGLTKHRCGLFPLEPVDKESARTAIDICESGKKGGINAICSDEMYIIGEKELPSYDYYGEFEQIENGVGLVAKFNKEFLDFLEGRELISGNFGIVTGKSATPIMQNVANLLKSKNKELDVQVFSIRNDFFGESVTVAGLITGGDIIAQLKGKDLPQTLLIPSVMLKEFETVFLDGIRIEQIQKELGVSLKIVPHDGEGLAQTFVRE